MMHFTAFKMEGFICCGAVAGKCVCVGVCMDVTLTHGLNGTCSCSVTQL